MTASPTTLAPTLSNQQETAQDISFFIIAVGIFISMIASLMVCVMVHKVKSYAEARKLETRLWIKAFKREVQAERTWFTLNNNYQYPPKLRELIDLLERLSNPKP